MSQTTDLPLTPPTQCPFCNSTAVTAASQKVTAFTYWRCETCGQLWHPDRLRSVRTPWGAAR